MSTVAEAPVETADAAAEDAVRTGAAVKVESMYLVLAREETGSWTILGEVKAIGPDAAKRLAIKQFALEDSLALEPGVTLVAVNTRYWKPTSVRVQTRTDVVFD